MYPRTLCQWIFENLNFMPGVEERNSHSYMIIDHFFDIDRTSLAINQPREFSAEDFDNISAVISRLKNHEPIQYILGEADFYGRKFYVDASVLIPRPETELIVDLIVKENPVEKLNILDICTGSGCIALSLKLELVKVAVTGIDVCEKTLQCAMKNAVRHQVHIDWLKSDILAEELPPFFYDVIVSNPPYVRECEKALMLKNVLDYEPHLALFVSDRDPLIFYQAIAKKGFNALKPGGKIYLEINEAFGDEVVRVLESEGFKQVLVVKDFQEKDRIVKGIKK